MLLSFFLPYMPNQILRSKKLWLQVVLLLSIFGRVMQLGSIFVWSLHNFYVLSKFSYSESLDFQEPANNGNLSFIQSPLPYWMVLVLDHGEYYRKLVQSIVDFRAPFALTEEQKERGIVVRIAQGTACLILLLSLLSTILYSRLIEWLDDMVNLSDKSCPEDEDGCAEVATN